MNTVRLHFFGKKTFTVFKVRRWLNGSLMVGWCQGSRFVLPGTVQALGRKWQGELGLQPK